MLENQTVENEEQEQTVENETESKTPEQSPEYPSFSSGMNGKSGEPLEGDSVNDIDLLKDVELEVTVELGRTRLSIGEVMELGQGSVIELDKMAGEPVDIRVNGILMASGEVIVLDDVFGVRITRLKERVERFQAMS